MGNKEMCERSMCECGHPKSCHPCGVGGCFYSGDKSSTIINFDDVTCKCNKFVLAVNDEAKE